MGHLRLSYLTGVLKDNGLSLVVIIIVWEIIEDIGFPALFVWLGSHVHPAFLIGAPAAWLLCLHWLAVPIMWGAWVKLKGVNRNGMDSNLQQQDVYRDNDIND